MKVEPRVAFFTDSFLEINGLAHTSRQFAAYAKEHDLPMLVVHAGPLTEQVVEGSVARLSLKRGRFVFKLDSRWQFDPLMWRHARAAVNATRDFNAEAIHITGPGDIGLLGAYVAHKLGLPLVMSWHANLHETAGR